VQGQAIEEVCGRCAIQDYVLVESQDEHVGTDDPESMTPAYVCKLLDMLLYHPFKNVVSKREEDALELLK